MKSSLRRLLLSSSPLYPVLDVDSSRHWPSSPRLDSGPFDRSYRCYRDKPPRKSRHPREWSSRWGIKKRGRFSTHGSNVEWIIQIWKKKEKEKIRLRESYFGSLKHSLVRRLCKKTRDSGIEWEGGPKGRWIAPWLCAGAAWRATFQAFRAVTAISPAPLDFPSRIHPVYQHHPARYTSR